MQKIRGGDTGREAGVRIVSQGGRRSVTTLSLTGYVLKVGWGKGRVDCESADCDALPHCTVTLLWLTIGVPGSKSSPGN